MSKAAGLSTVTATATKVSTNLLASNGPRDGNEDIIRLMEEILHPLIWRNLPLFTRVLPISGGAGFLPSTVSCHMMSCDGQDMCPVMAPIVWQHAKVCYPNLVAHRTVHRWRHVSSNQVFMTRRHEISGTLGK